MLILKYSFLLERSIIDCLSSWQDTANRSLVCINACMTLGVCVCVHASVCVCVCVCMCMCVCVYSMYGCVQVKVHLHNVYWYTVIRVLNQHRVCSYI